MSYCLSNMYMFTCITNKIFVSWNKELELYMHCNGPLQNWFVVLIVYHSQRHCDILFRLVNTSIAFLRASVKIYSSTYYQPFLLCKTYFRRLRLTKDWSTTKEMLQIAVEMFMHMRKNIGFQSFKKWMFCFIYVVNGKVFFCNDSFCMYHQR